MKLNIGDSIVLMNSKHFYSDHIGQIFKVTNILGRTYNLENDEGNQQIYCEYWGDDCIQLVSRAFESDLQSEILDKCNDISGVFSPEPTIPLESKSSFKYTQEDIFKPLRYNSGKIEVWDYILDQNMDFLEGSVIKYVSRYKQKGGIKDLEKAKVYLDKIIEQLKKNNQK